MNRVAIFLATGAHIGRLPKMPGTFGSLEGVLVVLALKWTGWGVYLAVLIALIIVGTWAAGRAQIEYQVVDDQRIVIDEIAGMLLAMLLVPVTFKALLTGFILFRVFDIWKPVRSLEDLPAGAGVMADDLFAGLLANAGLRVASLFW